MEPGFWLERWQRNEIGFHQAEFNAHLQAYWPQLGLAAGATVFVPLCGKSRDLLWLRAQGHPVLGVELSPIAVRDFFADWIEARAAGQGWPVCGFAENALTPTRRHTGALERWETDELAILCGDYFALTPALLAGVAGVYDRASLIALPPPLRGRYAQQLTHILPASAVILLVTMEYPQGEMTGPPFPVLEEEVHTLYAARYEVTRLAAQDILAENQRFRERGLTALVEKVYRLVPRR